MQFNRNVKAISKQPLKNKTNFTGKIEKSKIFIKKKKKMYEKK